jgi:6-phosphogluconolactonase
MRKVLTIVFIAVSFIAKAQVSTLYIGSYTNGKSEGIYTYQFDSETGSLKNKQLVTKSSNPSYIITNSNKEVVYAVTESNKYNNTNSGAIASYKVHKDGTLEKTAEMSSFGKHPCHISINKKENKVVVSNYSEGNFSVFTLKKNGELDTINQIVNLNKEEKKAHTHSAQFHKNDLFIADLGIDSFEHYTFRDSSYVSTKSISMTKKSGPRHFAMTKNRNYIYVINEYGGTISTLKKEGNSYVKTEDTSTLNPDYKGKNSCADIHISQDEKFLYGSNRGENSIVVFEINKKDGSLKKVQSISCHGNWPRNFTLGPQGKFLLVANEKSNNISVFLIDKKTGELTFIYDIEAANPTCLKF